MMDRKNIILLLLLLVLLFALSCAGGTPEHVQKRLVKANKVEAYGENLFVKIPGKFKASADANLAFRVGGTLQRIPVEVGDKVRKGDLLAQLDPRDYQVQLAATEAEYKRVKSETERIVNIYE